ncbi:unnamed protein product, partial [Symbiodinium pilosum]
DEIGEAETSMPRMPPPSSAPVRMSWEDDEHQPPQVLVDQQPPSPAGRVPEMMSPEEVEPSDNNSWSVDDSTQGQKSNEDSQDTSAGKAAQEVASSLSDESERPVIPKTSAPVVAAPLAPVPPPNDEEDDEEVNLETATF